MMKLTVQRIVPAYENADPSKVDKVVVELQDKERNLSLSFEMDIGQVKTLIDLLKEVNGSSFVNQIEHGYSSVTFSFELP